MVFSHLSSPSLTLYAFRFLLLYCTDEESESGNFGFIYVAHVCRQWRETALNHPLFWSRINLTNLTPLGVAEILARAKTVPLQLEVYTRYKDFSRLESFGTHLDDHISHTRYLKFHGYCVSTILDRLVSPTPALESLSLSHEYTDPFSPRPGIIPDNLFDCTAPSLTSLKLDKFDISWKSPLLKGLRILEILDISADARPELDDWLDALNEMPQLQELSLRRATPFAPLTHALISRNILLPSLTHFTINTTAKDCVLAFAHLIFPALTQLHVHVKSYDRRRGEDVLLLIPYVVQNVCVLQEIEPSRSIHIRCDDSRTEVVTSTTPGADVDVPFYGISELLDNAPRSACFLFVATCDGWNNRVSAAILDALLTPLSMNSALTLSAHYHDQSNKAFWLRNAPRWPLLEQVRLGPTTIEEFRMMLTEDIPLDSDGPRLPMLTKIILLEVELNSISWVLPLCDTLIVRVEQGVPLESLDLHSCVVTKRGIQLLAEIVVDVRKPPSEAPEVTLRAISPDSMRNVM